jgi:hypothetical protein
MRRSKSEPRMETMMELMHPRRLEKKANIRVIGVGVTCGRAFLRQQR